MKTNPRNKISLTDSQKLRDVIKDSFSFKEALIKLGVKTSFKFYLVRLKQRIKEENIDTSHFCIKRKKAYCGIESRKYLDSILFYEGREEICEECGISDQWNGKYIRLQIDHIDGNKVNNTLKNLRYLCPNCHSQTDTFCHKNRETYKNYEGAKRENFNYITEKVIARKVNILSKKYFDNEITLTEFSLEMEKIKFPPKKKPDTKEERRLKNMDLCNCGKNMKNRIAKNCIECASKNIKRKINIDFEQIKFLVWEKSMVKIAAELCCSDVALKKFCFRKGVILPEQGYWRKLELKLVQKLTREQIEDLYKKKL